MAEDGKPSNAAGKGKGRAEDSQVTDGPQKVEESREKDGKSKAEIKEGTEHKEGESSLAAEV